MEDETVGGPKVYGEFTSDDLKNMDPEKLGEILDKPENFGHVLDYFMDQEFDTFKNDTERKAKAYMFAQKLEQFDEENFPLKDWAPDLEGEQGTNVPGLFCLVFNKTARQKLEEMTAMGLDEKAPETPTEKFWVRVDAAIQKKGFGMGQYDTHVDGSFFNWIIRTTETPENRKNRIRREEKRENAEKLGELADSLFEQKSSTEEPIDPDPSDDETMEKTDPPVQPQQEDDDEGETVVSETAQDEIADTTTVITTNEFDPTITFSTKIDESNVSQFLEHYVLNDAGSKKHTFRFKIIAHIKRVESGEEGFGLTDWSLPTGENGQVDDQTIERFCGHFEGVLEKYGYEKDESGNDRFTNKALNEFLVRVFRQSVDKKDAWEMYASQSDGLLLKLLKEGTPISFGAISETAKQEDEESIKEVRKRILNELQKGKNAQQGIIYALTHRVSQLEVEKLKQLKKQTAIEPVGQPTGDVVPENQPRSFRARVDTVVNQIKNLAPSELKKMLSKLVTETGWDNLDAVVQAMIENHRVELKDAGGNDLHEPFFAVLADQIADQFVKDPVSTGEMFGKLTVTGGEFGGRSFAKYARLRMFVAQSLDKKGKILGLFPSPLAGRVRAHRLEQFLEADKKVMRGFVGKEKTREPTLATNHVPGLKLFDGSSDDRYGRNINTYRKLINEYYWIDIEVAEFLKNTNQST